MDSQNQGCCQHHAKAYLAIIMSAVLVLVGLYVISLTRNSMRAYDYIGKTPDIKDRITLTGIGKVTAKPDVGIISLGIISESATVAQAQKDNANKMNSIISALKKEFKIDEKDIQTSNYSINPKYDWSTRVQRIVGYSINQTITIKIRDFDKIGEIIAKATELGSNSVNGPSFTIDDPEVFKAQAREKAITQAKEKADVLAKQVGIRLGRIVNFSEGGNDYYPMPLGDASFSLAKAETAPAVAPDIQAGSQEVSVSVSISYEIK